MSTSSIPAAGRVIRSVTSLVNSGKSLEEIIAERGDREIVIDHLAKSFGMQECDSRDRVAKVDDLHRRGVHPSVISVIIGTNESDLTSMPEEPAEPTSNGTVEPTTPVEDITYDSYKSIVLLIQEGKGINQIKDELKIDFEVILSAVSAYEEGLFVLPKITDDPETPEDNTYVDNTANSDESVITPEGQTTGNATSPEDEDMKFVEPLSAEVSRLARLNRTLDEISEDSGLSKVAVLRIAKTAGLFIPKDDDDRLTINTAARLATEGSSLDEISESMELDKEYLKSTLIEVVKGKGRGHDIFESLLESEVPASSLKPYESTAPAVHADNILNIGDSVKVKSRAEMEPRDGISWLQGKTVQVESVLNGVVMVSLDYKNAKVHELLLLSEISHARLGDSWVIGEEIAFDKGDGALTGKIKTIPLIINGDYTYGVEVDGQDIVVKSTEIIT